MLLGIVLHGAMSFIPGVGLMWGVQDSQASSWFGVMLAAIHGWRMPLFFLVSGFFTAMLWKKRGLRSLFVHRFKRIFLPLVLSMITIIPLMWFVSDYIRSHAATEDSTASQVDVDGERESQAVPAENFDTDIWEAVMLGDGDAIERYLTAGGDVNARNPTSGATPFHVACFFGRPEVATLLLDAGASLEPTNNEGLTPEHLLMVDWGTTEYIAKMLQMPLDKEEVFDGRNQIAKQISEVTGNKVDTTPKDSGQAIIEGLIGLLFFYPVFNHLWFLWFLCWFVVAFVVIAKAGSVLKVPAIPNVLIRSWWRYLWLIPLAVLPQYFMARSPGGFGPDTSIGLLPLPAVFAYYAIFFAFGAMYFGSQDRDVAVGRYYGLSIAFALAVLFPIGLSMSQPELGGERFLFSLFQVSYAWFMSFGMMGLFHRLFSDQKPRVRYLSDSSYWLYLVHIPLVMYLQFLVRDLEVPGLLKFMMVCSVSTVLLLLSYQLLVRKTWLGVLLNGRRYLKASPGSAETESEPVAALIQQVDG